jgi:hypothetical protein
MSCYYLIGIRMDNRVGNAQKFQETLTKNGCKIRARLGLHDVTRAAVPTTDVRTAALRRQVRGGALTADLNALPGVTAG